MIFWMLMSIANAELVEDIDHLEYNSIVSIGPTIGISLEEARSYVGYDVNWDMTRRRLIYNFDMHIYSGVDTAKEGNFYYYNQVNQHNVGFMVAKFIKLYAVHRYEESNYNGVLKHYIPGCGLSAYLLRKETMQFEVFAGSSADIVESEIHGVELIHRAMIGTAGYLFNKQQTWSVNWYSWLMPSLEQANDLRLATNIDVDRQMLDRLYLRMNIHHVYESAPLEEAYPDTRATLGMVWSQRPSQR